MRPASAECDKVDCLSVKEASKLAEHCVGATALSSQSGRVCVCYMGTSSQGSPPTAYGKGGSVREGRRRAAGVPGKSPRAFPSPACLTHALARVYGQQQLAGNVKSTGKHGASIRADCAGAARAAAGRPGLVLLSLDLQTPQEAPRHLLRQLQASAVRAPGEGKIQFTGTSSFENDMISTSNTRLDVKFQTRWPSGPRRCVQVAVRKGAGSNPARVTHISFCIFCCRQPASPPSGLWI